MERDADDLAEPVERADLSVPSLRRGLARVGRPKGQTAEATRARIVDAAEALFAEGGYDGTSIRDIAQAANVQIAVITYHFGPKEMLFEAVVQRRAAIMTEKRLRTLVEARRKAKDGPVDLDVLVRGYVAPFFDMARSGDAGWRNYATLMGRLANSPRGTDVIARHYDATARAYLDAFTASLPGAPERAVVDGFMIMVSSMLSICAGTGRADRLMRRDTATGDADLAYAHLVDFVVAGFQAIRHVETGKPA
jgi:AcrR family transcriptional regulator